MQDKIAISDLKVQLEDANANVERLKAELLRKTRYEETANATVSIDFNAIKCFSVERNQSNNGTPITIIGYNLPTDAENAGPREWTLYCSSEQHERLVEEFNKQRKGK
jgi:hypothetical protein